MSRTTTSYPGSLVLELDRDLAADLARSDAERTPSFRRLGGVRREPQADLPELALVRRDGRQLRVELGDDATVGEARLVRQELDRLQHHRVHVGRAAPAPGVADELEQAPGDLLAAIGLLLDEAEVVREIVELGGARRPAVRQAPLERLRAAGDRREGAVQLV